MGFKINPKIIKPIESFKRPITPQKFSNWANPDKRNRTLNQRKINRKKSKVYQTGFSKSNGYFIDSRKS